MKKFVIVATIAAGALGLTGCSQGVTGQPILSTQTAPDVVYPTTPSETATADQDSDLATATAQPTDSSSSPAAEDDARLIVIRPKKDLTPGATNDTVTQESIGQTICVKGWTSTVRPPSTVTSAIKRRQLDSGYNYKGDTEMSHYEEDHLIPLELGGSSDDKNLWPEYTLNTQTGAFQKDALENKLKTLVCGGKLSLQTAQHAIATDWWAAYKKYVVAG